MQRHNDNDDNKNRNNEIQQYTILLLATSPVNGLYIRTLFSLSVLSDEQLSIGRDFRDGDNIRLMNFLKAQERNGKYFTKAMDKELPKSDESEAATDAS